MVETSFYSQCQTMSNYFPLLLHCCVVVIPLSPPIHPGKIWQVIYHVASWEPAPYAIKHLLYVYNVGCTIVNHPLNIYFFFWGGQHSNSKFGSDFWNLSFCWWKVLAALKRVLLYFAFSKHLKTKPGNWNSLLPCLVQVYYCYSGACKGDTLCGLVFLFFFFYK